LITIRNQFQNLIKVYWFHKMPEKSGIAGTATVFLLTITGQGYESDAVSLLISLQPSGDLIPVDSREAKIQKNERGLPGPCSFYRRLPVMYSLDFLAAKTQQYQ
jgi:hypothetical protein